MSSAGYAHFDYVRSLGEFGAPRRLERCGGWILERRIPGTSYRDAMGCYPLFVCRDWSQLNGDLEGLGTDLVSLALVTDPFGDFTEADLHRCFPDHVIAFKEHYVTDLQCPIGEIASRGRRKKARRALRKLTVEECTEPHRFLDEWVAFYEALTTKHGITGLRAFSREAFSRQLRVPGMIMFRALNEGKPVGSMLWYARGEVAYGHLAAFSDPGYELGASHALDWTSIESLRGRVRWLDQGAAPGTVGGGNEGLDLYKRGWATGTRTAWFCGRILDHGSFAELAEERGVAGSDYFPAYREGEFG